MQYDIATARSAFAKHRSRYEQLGAYIEGAQSYLPEEFKRDFNLAMDAAPALSTDPNGGLPSMLTTYIDADVYEIIFAILAMGDILGEQRKGDWTTQTAMFPVVESAGEVTSYGDYNDNGRVTANTNWPQFQSYLFQTHLEYGDLELERAGLAKINWVSELQKAAARMLNTYANFAYAFGVQGLQNYGLLNSPVLPAALTPTTKASPGSGTAWFTPTGAPNCTANEVYNDITMLFEQLVNQNGGHVDKDTAVTLAMSPGSSIALTFTNSFNVNVEDLLKKNFPNITLKVAPQYGAVSASNPQGIVAGNMVQMIAESVEGQKTGFSAYNEKLRTHRLVPWTSSFRQKLTSGVWGTVIRYAAGIVMMVGV
jgi:hypothetical protein